jgi:hypothetical protein
MTFAYSSTGDLFSDPNPILLERLCFSHSKARHRNKEEKKGKMI